MSEYSKRKEQFELLATAVRHLDDYVEVDDFLSIVEVVPEIVDTALRIKDSAVREVVANYYNLPVGE